MLLPEKNENCWKLKTTTALSYLDIDSIKLCVLPLQFAAHVHGHHFQITYHISNNSEKKAFKIIIKEFMNIMKRFSYQIDLTFNFTK